MWQMAGSLCRVRAAHPRREVGTRELEAELWKLFLARVSFSYWQFHTLLICEFWRLESPHACFFSPERATFLSSPEPPFHWGCYLHCIAHIHWCLPQPNFLTRVQCWLINGNLRITSSTCWQGALQPSQCSQSQKGIWMPCLVHSLMSQLQLCKWPDGGVGSAEWSEIVAELKIINISPTGCIVCGSSFLPKGHKGMPDRQLCC